VEAQLRVLAPGALGASSQHLVMLESRADGIQVRLFGGDGRLLEDRFLPGSASCGEWALAVAALLVTWETDLSAPDAAPPAPATPAAAPPAPRPEPPAAQPSRPPEDRWRGEIGLGVSGSLASDGAFAPGGELRAGLAPPRGPWGGELTLTGTGLRSLPVAGGSASWQRFALGLGGHGTLGSGALQLELGGEFLFGLLNSKGKGFAVPLTVQAFDPGIGFYSRGVWRFARSWLAWVQLGASFWPKTQEVQVVTGSATLTTTKVPPVDLSLTLGLSLAGDL
jgi:hypothetical protein